ncbi:MAG: hypothetical protein KatS3mg031_3061 [Chitinophagales bacterium]|nr:MAG: hypothetical protein KatS3mg031_3061 [Chitinophagales bacterium]
MKFFQLKANPNKIGQVEELVINKEGYDPWAPGGIYTIPLEGTPHPNFFLPDCCLSPKSQYTDFLNVVAWSGRMLTVSERVYSLLTKLNLDYHSVFQTNVYDKRRSMNKSYFGIYFHWFRNQCYIDWGKTTFSIVKGFTVTNELIKFDDYNHYRQWRYENFSIKNSELKSARVKDLYIKDSVIEKDLFVLDDIERIYIASERLRSSFEIAEITGVEFKDLPTIG